MGPNWFEKMEKKQAKTPADKPLATISEDPVQNENDQAVVDDDDDDDPPMPPGFPEEDAFEGFLCYKCVESNPWIKRYAGTSGFLPAVFLDQSASKAGDAEAEPKPVEAQLTSLKRKAEDDGTENDDAKRIKSEDGPVTSNAVTNTVAEESSAPIAEENKAKASDCKVRNLSTVTEGRFSLFFKEDFRDKFCRCSTCFRHLNPHPQLLEEEDVYEPPISEEGASQHGGSTHGSGSLLERGESALRNVDRVRAIEGVMAYNHLKEQLKPFFQQFANSGQAIGAEDIKAYFAKLRGDEAGIKAAGEAAASSSKDKENDGDGRKEQSGY